MSPSIKNGKKKQNAIKVGRRSQSKQVDVKKRHSKQASKNDFSDLMQP